MDVNDKKELTLHIQTSDCELLFMALMELPLKAHPSQVRNGLIVRLREQINAQIQPPPPADMEEAPKENKGPAKPSVREKQ